jgi:hypothetical protein
MIVSDQVVAALASAAIPTFAVLVGILINNQRLNDFSRSVDQRFNDSSRSIDQRFIDTNRHIDDMRDALRADMYRMEQVMDARLKHLEEHL